MTAASPGPEPGPSRWNQHWRQVWRDRLAGQEPAALAVLDSTLLWGVAVPMLAQLEERLRGSGTTLPGWRGGASRRRRPLLALNAPVGTGKTSLARVLAALAPLAGIRLAVASIDDLYLPWPERRRALAGNPFGVWRVPPGSHDLPVLLAALKQWRDHGRLRLPRFDKTLRAGQGDRCGWREQPADALLLEGWLMGCRPLGPDGLTRELARASNASLSLPLSAQELDWLPQWDTQLAAYPPLWDACDGLWLMRPSRWTLPLRWRLQAEARQRRQGGGWLPADELIRMVRATLCSLPPELYQQPLERGRQHGGSTGAGTVEDEPTGEGSSAADSTGHSPVGAGSAEAGSAGKNDAADGSTGNAATADGISGSHRAGPRMGMAASDDASDTALPLLGMAVLDHRRRCRSSWTQPSESSVSSATG